MKFYKKNHGALILLIISLLVGLLLSYIGAIYADYFKIHIDNSNYIKNQENTHFIRLFLTYTFFTNELCLVIVVAKLFFKDSRIAKSSMLSINAASYIAITCLLYWTALAPSTLSSFFNGEKIGVFPEWAGFIFTLFLHAISPIGFIVYIIWEMKNNKLPLAIPLKKFMLIGLIFPITYIVGIYIMSWAWFPIYGSIINVNKDIVIHGTPGSPVKTLIYIGAIIIEILSLFGFWKLNAKFSKVKNTQD